MNKEESITILNNENIEQIKKNETKEENVVDDKYVQKLPEWNLLPPHQLLKRVVRK